MHASLNGVVDKMCQDETMVHKKREKKLVSESLSLVFPICKGMNLQDVSSGSFIIFVSVFQITFERGLVNIKAAMKVNICRWQVAYKIKL